MWTSQERGVAPAHLDAVFKGVAWRREAPLLVNGLTENDQLFKEENPSFSGSGQDTALLLTDEEGVLLEQLPLGCDLPLEDNFNPASTTEKIHVYI